MDKDVSACANAHSARIIKSQDSRQIHYMPVSTPCYFNVAPALVDGEKEGDKITLYSVGINNASFGIFKEKEKAVSALLELENFLIGKALCFQIPADE